MPLDGSFIQMLSTLSEVQTRKKQIQLEENKYNTAVKQYEQEHHDRDVTQALQQLAAANADSRVALLKLYDKNFTPEEKQALSLFASSAPIDPRLMTADAIQRGVTAMQGTPLAGQVNQAAAVSQLTGGQNVGGMAANTFQSQLYNAAPTAMMAAAAQNRAATGMNPLEADTYTSLVNQGLIPQMARNAAGFANPLQKAQLALQQAGLNIQKQQADTQQAAAQSGSELGWANLREEDKKLAQQYNIQAFFKGVMNPEQMSNALLGMSKMVVDMTSPNTDSRARSKLAEVFNTMAGQIGHPELAITDPSQAPARAAAIIRYIGAAGINQPSMPAQGGYNPVYGQPNIGPLQGYPQQPQPNMLQQFAQPSMIPTLPTYPGYIPLGGMRPNP